MRRTDKMTSVARVSPSLGWSYPRVQESIKLQPIMSDVRAHQEPYYHLNNGEFQSFESGNMLLCSGLEDIIDKGHGKCDFQQRSKTSLGLLSGCFQRTCVEDHKVMQMVWKCTESKQWTIRRQPQQSHHSCGDVGLSWSGAATKSK